MRKAVLDIAIQQVSEVINLSSFTVFVLFGPNMCSPQTRNEQVSLKNALKSMFVEMGISLHSIPQELSARCSMAGSVKIWPRAR